MSTVQYNGMYHQATRSAVKLFMFDTILDFIEIEVSDGQSFETYESSYGDIARHRTQATPRVLIQIGRSEIIKISSHNLGRIQGLEGTHAMYVFGHGSQAKAQTLFSGAIELVGREYSRADHIVNLQGLVVVSDKVAPLDDLVVYDAKVGDFVCRAAHKPVADRQRLVLKSMRRRS